MTNEPCGTPGRLDKSLSESSRWEHTILEVNLSSFKVAFSWEWVLATPGLRRTGEPVDAVPDIVRPLLVSPNEDYMS